MYQLIRKKQFDKSIQAVKSKKNILQKVFLVLEVLQNWPPFEKKHSVHLLHWTYKNFYSINISWDLRIIFSVEWNSIILHFFWTHSQLYW